MYTSIQAPREGQPKQLSSYKHVVKMHLRHSLLTCKNIKSRFFVRVPGLTERRKDKQTKPTKLLCSRAFPRRLCVRAPLTNVALEMWIQFYGKLSCQTRYLLQSLLYNFVSSHFSGFAKIAVAWLQRWPQIQTEFDASAHT